MSKKQSNKATTKTPKSRCGWCDRYGDHDFQLTEKTPYLGRTVEEVCKKVFCNHKCFKAYQLQERAIDIKRWVESTKHAIKLNKEDLLTYFKMENKTPEDITDSKELMLYTKAQQSKLTFLKAVLAREKKQVLHGYRYKTLKLYGECLEQWMTTDKPQYMIDKACNEIAMFKDQDAGELCGAELDIEMFGT